MDRCQWNHKIGKFDDYDTTSKKFRNMKLFTSIVSIFFLSSAVAFTGNKIYYVTTDNQPITPNVVEMGVHIISNTYTEASDIYPEGCWTLEFDRDITTVDGFNALTKRLKALFCLMASLLLDPAHSEAVLIFK